MLAAALASTLLLLPAPAEPTAPAARDPLSRAAEARRRGDFATARRLYEQALAAERTDARAAVGLGETMTDMGQAAEAETLLLRVVEALPDRPEPRRALARAYLRLSRPKDAVAQAARAVDAAPSDASSRVVLGLAQAAAGESGKGLASIEKALELRPGNPEALAALALFYATVSDPRAGGAYEKAIGSDPRNLPLRAEFAEYLWRERRYDRGNAQMDALLRQLPDNTRLRVHYGLALADQRRFADAAKQFDAARRRGDESADLLFYLGSALWEVGRFDEASARLREAASRAPGNAMARHRLGRLLVFRGDAAAAVPELEAAAKLDAKSADVALDLGRAYEAAGRKEDAEAAYRRALELQPDLSVTHYTLGTLLARSGRREEAAREIARYQEFFDKEQASRRSAASRQAEINLGWTELDAGRAESALAHFAKHADDVEALRGAAASLAKLDRHEEAVRSLERALLLEPDNRGLAWELDRERSRSKSP